MPIQQPPITATGTQPVIPGEDPSNLLGVGAATAAFAASGFVPIGQKRLWDHYIQGIRSFEEATPGAIFKTFRLSETLSPLESWRRVELTSDLLKGNNVFSEYLRNALGPEVTRANIYRTGSILGQVRDQSGNLVGYSMQVASGTQRGAAIADYYARVQGMELGSNVSLKEGALRASWARIAPDIPFEEFKKGLPYRNWDPLAQKEPRIPLITKLRPELNILGARVSLKESTQKLFAQMELVANFFRARAASTVGRLNNLLSKPFEIPVLGNALSRIPILNKIGIEPGTSSQMIGRYIKKGLLLGGAWKGLEYYDYLRSSGSPLAPLVGTGLGAAIGGVAFRATKSVPFSRKGLVAGAALGLYSSLAPKFDQGFFYGIGRTLADVDVTRASISEKIGLGESLRRQDQVTPGLVSWQSALGFAGVGGLMAGTGRYGGLLYAAAKEKYTNKGKAFNEIFNSLRVSREESFASSWASKVGRRVKDIPFIGKALAGVKSPTLAGAIGGLAAWTALSSGLSLLSGNFMAAIPGLNLLGSKENPEELEAVYSGEKDVAIRKGRWWEAGRSSKYEGCLTSDSTILMADGTIKPICKIQIGDQVINYKGKRTTVLNIASRRVSEEVFKIYSPWDRTDTTKVTANHEVLAYDLSEYNQGEEKSIRLNWIPASELTTNHCLFIPELAFSKSIVTIKVIDCLPKDGYKIYRGNVYVKANNCALAKDDQQILDDQIVEWGMLPRRSVVRRERQNEIIRQFSVSVKYIRNRLSDLRKKTRTAVFAGYRLIDTWPEEIELDYDFGSLIGYYAAEGNIDKDNGTVSFSFHKNETKYHNDIFRLLNKFNCTYRIDPQGDSNGIIIDSYSTVLKHILSSLCPGTARKGDKQLNPILLNASEEFINGFLEAFVNGDGSPKPYACSCNIGLSTPVLLKQIQMLMASKGIGSSSNSRLVAAVPNGEKIHRAYELTISGFDAERLYSLMKDPKPGKHEANYSSVRKIKISNGWLLKIDKIEIIHYEGEVWDIQVEEGNSFLSTGITLHNSSIEYYRKHSLERLRTRAYQKGIYGEESERWEYDPLLHPLKALFGSDDWKYHYEMTHQYDRPSPLTGTWGEDVPFVGPLIAATAGRLLKPRKFVRPDEWMLGNGEYVHHPGPRPAETEPDYSLGGLGPGAPVLPEEGTQLFNELLYRRREAVGLMGYASSVLQKGITGREELFQNLQTVGTMGKETGGEYWLWKHLNLGGAATMSEPVRRFIPHTRSYLDEYNPLEAEMASWLPRDYFIDVRKGNPFADISEAEIRMPGSGFAALNPEVEGLDPEDYPLAYRLKILADIAPWSPEYDSTLKRAMASRDSLPENQQMMIQTIREQVRQRKTRREFDEYRFDEDLLETIPVTVKDVISPSKFTTEEFGRAVINAEGIGAMLSSKSEEQAREILQGRKIDLAVPTMESRMWNMGVGGTIRGVPMIGDRDLGSLFAEEGIAESTELKDEFEQLRYESRERAAGAAWEWASRAVETPLEYLTPISPAAKLIRKRSAIETYVAEEAIGTGSAFWDRPIENFLLPAKEMTEAGLGDEEIPEYIQKKRSVQEYFDILQYVKSQKLRDEAMEEGRYKEAGAYERQMDQTLFGVDPFANPTNAMRALPRNERDFYSAFSDAKTEEERAQILSLVPRDEQRIYASRWITEKAAAIRAKIDAQRATNEDVQMISEIIRGRKSEGLSYDKEQEEQWLSETGGKMSFADWLRQKKLKEYFATRSLPDPSWVAWSPSVDLKDIEAKYLQMEGCISGDSKILSGVGVVRFAKDIRAGEKLINSDGYLTGVKEIFMHKNDNNTYKLKNSGMFDASIVITGNHIVPIVRQYLKEYRLIKIPVDKIRPRDKMIYPKLFFEESKEEIDLLPLVKSNAVKYDEEIFSYGIKGKKHQRMLKLDASFGSFLGWYVAEGYCAKTKGGRLKTVIFSLSSKETEEAEEISRYAKRMFNANTTISPDPNGADALLVRVHSAIAASVVKLFCTGDKATTKTLTEDFFKLPKETILYFLRSWFFGDGFVDKRKCLSLPKNISIQTSSETLGRQGWNLLNSLGIRSRLQFIKVRPSSSYKSTSPAFRINIGDHIAKIAFLLCKEVRQQDYLETCAISDELEKYFWFGVNKKKIIINDPILYDFDMGEPHFYTTICGVVHNSDNHDFDLWQDRMQSLSRKPYINSDVVSRLESADNLKQSMVDEGQSLNNLYAFGRFIRSSDRGTIRNSKINANIGSRLDIVINDRRQGLVDQSYQVLGN